MMNLLPKTTLILLTTTITIAINLLTLSSTRATASCNRVCRSSSWGNETTVPYPFGFSDECQIRLNCSTIGDHEIGGFQLINITEERLCIYLPRRCDRAMSEIRPLFGRNYAPTQQNIWLLQNCTSPLSICGIPSVKSHMEFCGNNYSSCYSEESEEGELFDYENLYLKNCSYLISSFAVGSIGNSAVDFEFDKVELSWWLDGPCSCVANANCTIVSLASGAWGHRCKCRKDYHGDGFIHGSGCNTLFDENLHWELAAFSVFGAIAILPLIIFCFRRQHAVKATTFFWEKKKVNDQSVEALMKKYGSLAPQRYYYLDIKKMTNSFTDKLGEGGYGNVFKGKLSNGRPVAVKVLSETNGNIEDFVNEVASISRTSHVNIVTLLGFCLEGNKRALIYEFMPNGSLDSFLRNDGSFDKIRRLDWKTLYQIAVGSARGLEYLHRGCNTRIVHFDIKPGNILLDEELLPKISDFGLAKLCKRKESVVSMMGTRGTPGYIAPEVFCRNFGEVSHKSDVYSYGMMIINMIGLGEKIEVGSTCVSSASEMYFLDLIYKHLEVGEAKKVLQGIKTEEEEEMARKMILVGLWCIQMNPLDRPSMSKVVDMMEGSLQSLQIPPKPYLYSPRRSTQQSILSLPESSEIELINEL